MGIALKSKAKTTNELQEWTELIEKLRFKTSLEGYTLVKENALKFFKQQNLIKVANKILEIAGNGDIDRYDECQKLLDDASLAGNEDEFGFSPYDLEDKALSQEFKVPSPTGISKLDDALNGGLEKKKIGLIVLTECQALRRLPMTGKAKNSLRNSIWQLTPKQPLECSEMKSRKLKWFSTIP